jgi:hypothetical protein
MLMPDVAVNPMSGVIEFLLSPLLLIVTLFVVSGVCHLCLMMTGGANYGFQTSARVFAYAYSPALFGVIPFLGNLVAFFWMIVLAVVGLREAHRTTTGSYWRSSGCVRPTARPLAKQPSRCFCPRSCSAHY